ncbi:MAG: OmpH family outer membrane protein [Thermoanaerobaculales bacterium]
MSFRKLLLALAATLFLVGAANAQQAAPAQENPPVKLGFVDVERALASTDEGKVQLKALDEWARPRRDEINQLGQAVNDLQRELMTKQGSASEDVLSALNRQFIAKKRELEDKQRDAKRDFDLKQTTVLKELGGKLQQVIAKFADANRYTAVFILKADDLAYLAKTAELTETVVKLYNESYPVASKAPTAAPSK